MRMFLVEILSLAMVMAVVVAIALPAATLIMWYGGWGVLLGMAWIAVASATVSGLAFDLSDCHAAMQGRAREAKASADMLLRPTVLHTERREDD